MDSAGRNFLALVGAAAGFLAWSLCGFAALVAVPVLDGSAPYGGSPFCLLPAAVLGGVLAAGAWRGGRSLWGRLTSSRKLAARIAAAAAARPLRLRTAAESSGLSDRVDLVDDDAAFAFTYGALAPRVAISRGLLDRLTDEELRAALEHEAYHVRHRDPLRSLIAAALTDALSVLPFLAVLQERYEACRELAADVRAERACGRRALLAALVKALEEPRHERAPGPALAGPAMLEARVQRLEAGRAPQLPGAEPRTVAWSAYGATSFVVLGLACPVPLVLLPALALWLGARSPGRARR